MQCKNVKCLIFNYFNYKFNTFYFYSGFFRVALDIKILNSNSNTDFFQIVFFKVKINSINKKRNEVCQQKKSSKVMEINFYSKRCTVQCTWIVALHGG